MNPKQVKNLHNKSLFYLSYKKVLVVENSFPIIEKLNIINISKRAIKTFTYDFSTLYTTISHNLLIKIHSEIIHFVFKLKGRTIIGFSATFIYWTSKSLRKRYFMEKVLIEVITFFTKNIII